MKISPIEMVDFPSVEHVMSTKLNPYENQRVILGNKILLQCSPSFHETIGLFSHKY